MSRWAGRHRLERRGQVLLRKDARSKHFLVTSCLPRGFPAPAAGTRVTPRQNFGDWEDSEEINAPGRSFLDETGQNWDSPHGKDVELMEEIQRRLQRCSQVEKV